MNRRCFVGAAVGYAATMAPFSRCLTKSHGSSCLSLEKVLDKPIDLDHIGATEYILALHVVIKSNLASIALVQRYLRLGYSAACMLLKAMEETGVVSRCFGSNGYRTVLLDPISRKTILAKLDAGKHRTSVLTRRQFELGWSTSTGEEVYLNTKRPVEQSW
ncbi:MAG: hypothetical protein K9J74_01280 [Sulfuritalea sp.]|nr:hypothetical protein [Sulfuritalea sp.]